MRPSKRKEQEARRKPNRMVKKVKDPSTGARPAASYRAAIRNERRKLGRG